MARFSIRPFMLFLACAAVMISPGLGSDAAEAPSPTVIDLGLIKTNPHEGLSPEPQPGYYDYLDSCAAKMPVECSKEIVDVLLETKSASYVCCQNLIKIGKDCHEELVKALASLDKYKDYASVLPQRGSDVWHYCDILAAAPGPFEFV